MERSVTRHSSLVSETRIKQSPPTRGIRPSGGAQHPSNREIHIFQGLATFYTDLTRWIFWLLNAMSPGRTKLKLKGGS